jgi:hypothetical protein
VREIGRALALGSQELPDPLRQPVDRRRDRSHLGGTRGRPAGAEIAGAQPVRGLREVGHRAGHRAGHPVRHDQGEQQQGDAETGQDQPRLRHPGPEGGGGDEHLDQRDAVDPLHRLQQEDALGRLDLLGTRRCRDVAVGGVAEPGSVGPAHGGPEVRRAADEVGGHLLPLIEPDRGGEELQLRLARVDRPRLGHPGDEGGRGEQEGQQDDGRGRRDEQRDLPPHGSGSASRTPTPRTVCRRRGDAADSPSLRRSHDRWTSTVLSEPP